MLHHELVEFVKQFNVQRYLEIGFGDGINFIEMPVDYKVCISPSHPQEPQNIQTSDSIKFYRNKSEVVFNDGLNESPFDLIFIDGMHEYTHVIQDIYNCYSYLKDDGVIIVHDVNPLDKPDYISNKYETPGKEWCGDVWKSVFHVALLMPHLGYCVINDQDWPGFMVLWKIKQIRTTPESNIQIPIINNIKFPFDGLVVDDARNNPNIFNYKKLNDIIEYLKIESKFS